MPFVALTELVAGARSGNHIISIPTDTVPALAVRPDRATLIFVAKQRSQTKPLILMAASAADLWGYVDHRHTAFDLWQQVAAQHWPGALTLVLPASDRVSPEINPTDPTTIGIRVPNHPIARHILAQTQTLATTSANRSGQPPLETLQAIIAEFPAVLALSPAELDILQQSLSLEKLQPSSSIPSTVAKWTANGWEILRQGGVKLEK